MFGRRAPNALDGHANDGVCAHLNKAAAQKAIVYAEKYIDSKEGLILASSADLFLGDFGAPTPC